LGTSVQANAAASFFARAHQKLQLNNNEFGGCSSPAAASTRPNNEEGDSSEETEAFPTNFRTLVHRSPPQIPSNLLRRLELSSTDHVGKIRVVLRVARGSSLASTPDGDIIGNQIFQMDRKRRQLTMYDPTAFRGQQPNSLDSVTLEERKVGVAAPKMFAFDNVFTDEDAQEEVANSALSDIITSVVNGNDGCLFCFGHANLGKSRSMLGSDESSRSMGMIPIAIAWLYRAIKERKTR
jgi:kinesin family protein 26